ncbi:hypothetical protein GCM10007079_08600 [Nocardiopsis terrae]|uniref:DNA-binding SARP family transcriptional activator n=1 Tax=Nocardiopsis terrae TaxID=372655 RepID=A0ABR9HD26_9ACTN|nr:AfsR/SARP family transcriptional regulator [Nocardiopsis terrae]MBE1456922.1 DNA-binding SARP family transcriptional activator [Nocardiopsis terrae]GHC74378.1 hypothetical protein GCM10007079_08600 [Nocardiopsis terrae]
MHFRILGPIEVYDQDREIFIRPPGAMQRSLLATLVAKSGHAISIYRLICELWNDDPPSNATNALQAHVARLRRQLDGPARPGLSEGRIHTRPVGYVLDLSRDETDAEQFMELSTRGRALLGSDPGRAMDVMRSALALWRGPALEDTLPGDICSTEAAHLEEQRLCALETLYEAGIGARRYGEITGELETLTERHPLRERFYDLYMTALYQSGRQSEALGVYERARHRLLHELGVEPGPALHARMQAILWHAPDLAGPVAVHEVPGLDPVVPAPAHGHELGTELSVLRHRLDLLAREQEALVDRFERLTTEVSGT